MPKVGANGGFQLGSLLTAFAQSTLPMMSDDP
jgi:hypothetical protein